MTQDDRRRDLDESKGVAQAWAALFTLLAGGSFFGALPTPLTAVAGAMALVGLITDLNWPPVIDSDKAAPPNGPGCRATVNYLRASGRRPFCILPQFAAVCAGIPAPAGCVHEDVSVLMLHRVGDRCRHLSEVVRVRIALLKVAARCSIFIELLRRSDDCLAGTLRSTRLLGLPRRAPVHPRLDIPERGVEFGAMKRLAPAAMRGNVALG